MFICVLEVKDIIIVKIKLSLFHNNIINFYNKLFKDQVIDANGLVSRFLKFVLSWLSYVFIVNVNFERNKQNKYKKKIFKQKPF